MNLYRLKTNHFAYSIALITAIFLLVPAVFAQTDNSGLAAGVTQDQISAALSDLSNATGQTVDTKNQAITKK